METSLILVAIFTGIIALANLILLGGLAYLAIAGYRQRMTISARPLGASLPWPTSRRRYERSIPHRRSTSKVQFLARAGRLAMHVVVSIPRTLLFWLI
ncbi:MAG: hypothetical protein K6U00_10355, partial [Armatimonadetes bacterium]|nr:hypothetical protein [Armatimonadota bacterium]